MWQQILLSLLALHLVLLVIYIYLLWNRNFWKKRGVPTARPFTLIGTFPSIIVRNRNLIFDIQEVYRRYKEKYRAVGVFVTRTPQLLILDPKLANFILVSNFSHFHDTISSSWVNNRKADKYISRNPFWCAGEEWKTYRTDLVSGLTQNRVKQSLPIWESSCKKLRKFLEMKVDDSEMQIETKDLAYRFTADVMSDFIWGIDAETFSNKEKPNVFIEMASKWTNQAFNMLGYSYILTIAPFVRFFYPFRFSPKETDMFFSKLTKGAVKIRKENKNDTKRSDFLNHLLMLKAKKNISHDDMVGHSLSILMDGYETTGSALMHCLLHLGNSPKVQEKLRAEIQDSYDENKGGISYEAIQTMPYLDQCVYETLRLISLIPSFSRICTKNIKIPISAESSFELEEGMITIIPAYSFHLDDNIFAKAAVYNPDRFDNGAHYDMMKNGLLFPFGDGPRICAGQKVALLTIKSALVEILRNYDLSPGITYSKETSTKSFVLSMDGDANLVYKKRKF